MLPLDSSIARDLAQECNYREAEPADLAKVAQFIAQTDDTHNMFPKELLRKRFERASPPDFTDPDEPHAGLSRLPFPLYITTNYDDFLVRALEAENKEPKREFHRWNAQLRRISSLFDDVTFEPTVQCPVVFHVYGHTAVPESIVITEADYRDFLVNTSKTARSFPLRVERALTGTVPLFLGHDISHAKFLFAPKHLSSCQYISNRTFQCTKVPRESI